MWCRKCVTHRTQKRPNLDLEVADSLVEETGGTHELEIALVQDKS